MGLRYSSRHLTYPTDIFPALSGLANTFQLAYLDKEDGYLAGL